VRDGLDPARAEQHRGAVVGAVDGEHADIVNHKWTVDKVRFHHVYADHFA
jgi:hypothetical protein